MRQGNDFDDNIWDPDASAVLEKEYGNSSEEYDSDDESVEMRGLISGVPPHSAMNQKIIKVLGNDYSLFQNIFQSNVGKLLIVIIALMALYLSGHLGMKKDNNSTDETIQQVEDPFQKEGFANFWASEDTIDDHDDLMDNNGNKFADGKQYDELVGEEFDNYEVDDVSESSHTIGHEDFTEEREITTPFPFVQRIAVLGERNSGVDWFTEKLEECFPDIVLTNSLSRPGYFFQSEELYDSSQSTIVLPIFLNPYDWVNAMRENPRYMPNHMHVDDWETFVKKPWTLDERSARDKELWESIDHDPTLRVCQMGYKYNEVISCVESESQEDLTADENHPIYELRQDGSGEAYKSIMDLRADKIENFMSIMDWENVVLLSFVQYETLVEDGGFHFIAQHIADQSGLQFECDSTNPSFLAPIFWDREMNESYMDWMNENIHWDSESHLGYDMIAFQYDENASGKTVQMPPLPDNKKQENKGNWDIYKHPQDYQGTNSLTNTYVPGKTNYEFNLIDDMIEIEKEEENENTKNLSHEEMNAFVIGKSEKIGKEQGNIPPDEDEDAEEMESVKGDLSYLATSAKEKLRIKKYENLHENDDGIHEDSANNEAEDPSDPMRGKFNGDDDVFDITLQENP